MLSDIVPGISEAMAREAATLADTIKPLFAGRFPGVQGAALADLLAIWLAGHIVPNDPEAQAELREELLTAHIELVRLLLPLAWQGRLIIIEWYDR